MEKEDFNEEEESWTSIGLRKSTKDKLEKYKIHPNQSYDEVILKLIGIVERASEFKKGDEIRND